MAKIDRGSLVLLLGLATGSLQACEEKHAGGASGDWRVCVDAQGRRLEDGECRSGQSGPHGFTGYVPRRNGVPAVGGLVEDAAKTPSTAEVFSDAPATGVARGGFGATGEGHAGGGAGE